MIKMFHANYKKYNDGEVITNERLGNVYLHNIPEPHISIVHDAQDYFVYEVECLDEITIVQNAITGEYSCPKVRVIKCLGKAKDFPRYVEMLNFFEELNARNEEYIINIVETYNKFYG